MITDFHYTVLSLLVFTAGVFGVLFNRRNFILTLMSIEVILLGANINFIGYSAFHDDPVGVIYYMVILTVAAAEAAIALAILSLYFRNAGSISVEEASELKG